MIFQAIFGQINNPYQGAYNTGNTTDFSGGVLFFINILRLAFVVAGLLVLLNLVIAGFQFLNAQGDPKAIEQAWNKIWQSLVGLLIIVSSFIIIGLTSFIFFGDPMFILRPTVYGP